MKCSGAAIALRLHCEDLAITAPQLLAQLLTTLHQEWLVVCVTFRLLGERGMTSRILPLRGHRHTGPRGPPHTS
jgi:hypothetical protein